MRSITKTILLAAIFLVVIQAAEVPAGASLSVRLTSRISSADAKPGAPVTAVLLAPLIQGGRFILPPGAELTGVVKAVQSAAADPQKPPTLDLEFKRISFDAEHDTFTARVTAVDNAKEKVDEKGVITGTASSQTYTARMDRGIEKMSGNDRLSGLAGILEGVKKVLVQNADPEITYPAGVEMTLKTTAAFHVARPSAGVAGEVQPIADGAALAALVASMPLRALATDRRPSDITNLLLVGTEEQLVSAFETAGWSTAAKLNRLSEFQTALAMIEQRGYKEAPVSILLVDGRPPDMVYQKQNDTFDARHHVRIWRRPGTFDGRPVWLCTATHDIGISYSDQEHTFIHRIDSNIDAERAKVVNDLIFEKKVSGLALVARDGVPADAHNATGDALHTDGQVAVIILR